MRRLLFFLLVAVGTLRSQDVGLTATAPRSELRYAEPVRVTVTARLSVDVDSIGPAIADSVGMFEVLSVSRDADEHTWTFELMSLDTGVVFMAPIPFGFRVAGDSAGRNAFSNSLAFTVAGFDLPPNADIKDIKGPMTAPWTLQDVWPYLAVVLVIVGGWFLYDRFVRRRSGTRAPPATAAPPVPADVLALRELRDLEDRKLWQQGRTKEFYTECTEIVRRFFERRFGFPALELTSDETLTHLRRHDVQDEVIRSSAEFFERADLVKFAKWQASPEVHTRELASAFEIVRSLPVGAVETSAEEAAVHG